MTIVVGDTLEAVLAALYLKRRGHDNVRICPRPRSLSLSFAVFGPLAMDPDANAHHPFRSLFPSNEGGIDLEALADSAEGASAAFRDVAAEAGLPYEGAIHRPAVARSDRLIPLRVGLYPAGTRLVRGEKDPDQATASPGKLVPSSVPSPASQALAMAFGRKLDQDGIAVLDEEPLRIEPSGDRVKLVTNRKSHQASRLVFAPGKFTRLGIASSPLLSCRLLDAPVFLRDRVAERIDGERHFARSIAGPHPAHRIGLRIDGGLAILDRDDRPIHPGLLAAGDVVAGFDYIRDKGAFALLSAHLVAGPP